VPHFFFADNTVLVNFAILGESETLRCVVGTRGQWTYTVSCEWENTLKSPACPDMVERPDWARAFGAPVQPTPAERVDTKVIANGMRKPGETDSGKHGGEAETIAIILSRDIAGVLLTDDHDAARTARARGVQAAGTGHLIAMAEALGIVGHEKALGWLAALWDSNRVLGDDLNTAEAYHRYVQYLQSNRGSRS